MVGADTSDHDDRPERGAGGKEAKRPGEADPSRERNTGALILSAALNAHPNTATTPRTALKARRRRLTTAGVYPRRSRV